MESGRRRPYIPVRVVGGQVAGGKDFLELFEGLLLVSGGIRVADRVDGEDAAVLQAEVDVLHRLGLEEFLDGAEEASRCLVRIVACIQENRAILGSLFDGVFEEFYAVRHDDIRQPGNFSMFEIPRREPNHKRIQFHDGGLSLKGG